MDRGVQKASDVGPLTPRFGAASVAEYPFQSRAPTRDNSVSCRSPAQHLEGSAVEMIVCSCAYVTDRDLEQAVIEVMSLPNAPLPTPGVIYRHLQKKMQCCGCAPLAAETIYAKMEDLERRGLICPCACATAKTRMKEISQPDRRVKRPLRQTPAPVRQPETAGQKPARGSGSSL